MAGTSWVTKNGELGDSMSAVAARSLYAPEDDIVHKQVYESFVGFRPFRSPVHAKDPNVDLTRSFSRDHTLSLCWYGLFTGTVWPIAFIATYASHHLLKIGKEGSYSQHGMTPNVAWAINSVIRLFGHNHGWWYLKIWPSVLIALIQILSAKTVTVGYRLNLCAEMALLAYLTGKGNFVWHKVANICVERQPENHYYRFVKALYDKRTIGNKAIPADLEIFQKLLNEVNGILDNGFEQSHEWLWCWMNRSESGKLKACGHELLMLKAMLEKEIHNESIAYHVPRVGV